jgi:hypothetical protein
MSSGFGAPAWPRGSVGLRSPRKRRQVDISPPVVGSPNLAGSAPQSFTCPGAQDNGEHPQEDPSSTRPRTRRRGAPQNREDVEPETETKQRVARAVDEFELCRRQLFIPPSPRAKTVANTSLHQKEDAEQQPQQQYNTRLNTGRREVTCPETSGGNPAEAVRRIVDAKNEFKLRRRELMSAQISLLEPASDKVPQANPGPSQQRPLVTQQGRPAEHMQQRHTSTTRAMPEARILEARSWHNQDVIDVLATAHDPTARRAVFHKKIYRLLHHPDNGGGEDTSCTEGIKILNLAVQGQQSAGSPEFERAHREKIAAMRRDQLGSLKPGAISLSAPASRSRAANTGQAEQRETASSKRARESLAKGPSDTVAQGVTGMKFIPTPP